MRGTEEARHLVPEAAPLVSVDLPDDVLGFRLDKLAIPELLKVRLRYELDVDTVSDFIRALPPGKPEETGFGPRPIAQVWQQVSRLAERGGKRYLRDLRLDSCSFLELVEAIRDELGPKDLCIFDNRICPVASHVMTLQELGDRLHLTRERVRQREQRLILELEDGPLRTFADMIHQKTLGMFQPPIRHLTFRQLLMHPFFAGVRFQPPHRPGQFIFFSKVFHKTFEIGERAVSLTEATRMYGAPT